MLRNVSAATTIIIQTETMEIMVRKKLRNEHQASGFSPNVIRITK
jgi:hypothetical protein